MFWLLPKTFSCISTVVLTPRCHGCCLMNDFDRWPRLLWWYDWNLRLLVHPIHIKWTFLSAQTAWFTWSCVYTCARFHNELSEFIIWPNDSLRIKIFTFYMGNTRLIGDLTLFSVAISSFLVAIQSLLSIHSKGLTLDEIATENSVRSPIKRVFPI